MKTIAIANQKGGVGKTTTTMALGAALARQSKRVLLIDLDPQANLSSYLGFGFDQLPTISDLMIALAAGNAADPLAAIRRNAGEQLDYIPADLMLSNVETRLIPVMNREGILHRLLEQLQSRYDYALIDCLPSLGLLTVNAFAAADSVIIPVQPQRFAVEGMAALLDIIQQVRQHVNARLRVEGIVATMLNKTDMCLAVYDELFSQYGEVVYKSFIPYSTEAGKSSFRQQSLVSYSNRLKRSYDAFALEFVNREASA